MPQTAHGVEPLAALYRRGCATLIAASLRRGVRKITEALTGLRIELIDSAEWHDVDPHGHVLTNMNTPADYEEAQKWWLANERTKEPVREA
jgi:molybdopterin-guanine dinucleotide biosynthesis protein A